MSPVVLIIDMISHIEYQATIGLSIHSSVELIGDVAPLGGPRGVPHAGMHDDISGETGPANGSRAQCEG